jgi:hypothetical protein
VRRSIKQVPNYVRSLDVHVENIQFTIENVLVFELQSIPRIDCNLAIWQIESFKMTKAIQIIEF